MSVQRSFNRRYYRATHAAAWPKGATIDALNEGLAEVGVHLHPTKGFRTRAEWRSDAARKAARKAAGGKRSVIGALLNLLRAA